MNESLTGSKLLDYIIYLMIGGVIWCISYFIGRRLWETIACLSIIINVLLMWRIRHLFKKHVLHKKEKYIPGEGCRNHSNDLY